MSDKEQTYLELLDALANRDITVTLPALSAFMAVSSIQLATRHSGFPPNILPFVVEAAQQIIFALDPDPDGELHGLLAQGWDPAQDVKVSQS